MIRALRARHRAAAVALALMLPALLVAALVARVPVPLVAAVNPAIVPPGPTVDEPAGRFADGSPLTVRLHRIDGVPRGTLAVSVPAETLVGRSEVLAYWTPAGADGLVEHGTLLGTLRGEAPLALPADAGEAPGLLVLYDLAHAEVVATVPLRAVRDAR